MRSVATARANIALVKYWGKRDEALNLPARGSLSLTLDALTTRTLVELIDGPEDQLVLDGREQRGRPVLRISKFLDIVRQMSGSTQHARVTSVNAFPTAAGLASSASGFAALAVAATHAYGLHLPHRLLSGLARRGSGSAARSIYGGFVKMGVEYAEPIEHAKIELCAAIAVAKIRHKESAIESVMRVERELEASQEATRKSEARAVARLRSDSNAGAAPPLDPTLVENTHQKEIGSTDGMRHTAATSPYHAAWLETVDRDLVTAERALAEGDFDALAEVTEASCLAMHADAMAARPGILYFGPVTLWAISRVRALRAAGVPVFFTVDAGPHLVAFTTIEALQRVKETLEENADVAHVITARTGGPAVLEKEGEK